MDKSVNLPEFLPATPPGKRVLDLYGLLSPDDANILENQAQHLSYKPRILILPKDYSGESLPVLSAKIASAWKMEGNEFLLVLDMSERQLFGKAGSKLQSEGISDSYIADRLLADNFYQAAKDGNVSGGLFATLQALNMQVLNNRTSTSSEGTKTLSYTTGNSEAAHASYEIAWAGVGFFAFIVVVLVVIAWFGRQHKVSVADMKRAREKNAENMKRLEDFSRENPQMYLTRVMLLAFLGYAYIWFAMGLILVAAGLALMLMVKFPVLALKLALPMLLAFWLVARSFWVKMQPIEGIRLSRKDFPELFSMIEDTRLRIKAPKIDEVVLTEDLNAAVVQVPRLGLFGWNKNYLIIGASLMQAFSTEEFRGVLAHEMGHLAKSHSADLAWTYGMQRVWVSLMSRLEAEEHFATALFRNFFYWYIPYCDTYTFPLRREQEYNADQCSIDVVGKEAFASALIGLRVKANFLDRKYWSKISEDLKNVSAPPAAAFSNMAASFKDGIQPFDAESWLKESLRMKTDFSDTHPCLKDRLARIMGIPKEEVPEFAMSILPKASKTADPSAAQVMLGEKLPVLMKQIDDEWRIKAQPIWEEKHATQQEFKKELEELETKAQTEELTAEEVLLMAARTYQLKSLEEARPIFEKALEKNPKDSALREAYGMALFNEDDEACIEHLKFVMDKEPMRRYECAQRLCQWYTLKGEEEESEKYLDIIDHCVEEIIEYQKERAAKISSSDLFIEHGMEKEVFDPFKEDLKDFLKDIAGLEKVYIVRKFVKIFPESPLYIFVVEGKGWGKSAQALEYDCIQIISQSGFFNAFPAYPVVMSEAPKRLKEFLQSEPSALIFDRSNMFN